MKIPNFASDRHLNLASPTDPEATATRVPALFIVFCAIINSCKPKGTVS